jgi:hypothetical protein
MKGSAGRPVSSGSDAGNWRSYQASLILFACAPLSKTVVLSLPAAVLLVIYWKRGRIAARDVLRLAPFFAVGRSMRLFTSWVETHEILAVGQDWSLTLAERCLVAGRALWFYAAKPVAPVNLTVWGSTRSMCSRSI